MFQADLARRRPQGVLQGRCKPCPGHRSFVRHRPSCLFPRRFGVDLGSRLKCNRRAKSRSTFRSKVADDLRHFNQCAIVIELLMLLGYPSSEEDLPVLPADVFALEKHKINFFCFSPWLLCIYLRLCSLRKSLFLHFQWAPVPKRGGQLAKTVETENTRPYCFCASSVRDCAQNIDSEISRHESSKMIVVDNALARSSPEILPTRISSR